MDKGELYMTDKFYDNTRISAFRVCPRMFFYRHVKHWVPERLSPALVFGGGWHEMMDVVWDRIANNPEMDAEDIAKLSFKAFLDYWAERGMTPIDEMDEDEVERLGARHPMNAYEMVYNYIDERRALLSSSELKLLEIEIPFAVPLDPNNAQLFYVGRLDKVFSFRGSVYVGEHKTTSEYKKDGPFRDSFIDSFSPNSQVDGYAFAGHIKYGELFKGIWIDAALVHKQIHDAFKLIPIERLDSQLDAWLWETIYQVRQIEANKEQCSTLDPNDKYLAAFPKNTSSCSMYGGCTYRDVCRMIANPLGRDAPNGFKEEPWSPFKELELEKIGMKE